MKISVITPVFNSENFINEYFQCIYRQTYRPYEVVIVDDASNDNTLSIVETCASELEFPVTVIQLTTNQGPSHARNVGMYQAKGDWIAFLDSDDRWKSNHLVSLQQTALVSGASFVYSGTQVLDLITNRLLTVTDPETKRTIPHDLYSEAFIMPSQVMFQKPLLDNRLQFDESLSHAEDIDFWITLFHAGAEFAFSKENTAIYCKHSSSLSSDAEKICSANAYRMIKYLKYNDFSPSYLHRMARNYRLSAARLTWRKKPLRAAQHLACILSGNHDYL